MSKKLIKTKERERQAFPWLKTFHDSDKLVEYSKELGRDEGMKLLEKTPRGSTFQDEHGQKHLVIKSKFAKIKMNKFRFSVFIQAFPK